MIDTTNIISLNCCSIVTHKKRYQLQYYLNKYSPDIALLQDTRLTDRHRVEIANYKLNYLPKTDSNLGTAIALKNNIKSNVLNIEIFPAEGTFAETFTNNRYKILVGSLYFNP